MSMMLLFITNLNMGGSPSDEAAVSAQTPLGATRKIKGQQRLLGRTFG